MHVNQRPLSISRGSDGVFTFRMTLRSGPYIFRMGPDTPELSLRVSADSPD